MACTSSGFFGMRLQLGVEMHQRILQSEILVAIFFQKLRAILEGEAAFARRKHREEKLRMLAHAGRSLQHIGHGMSARRSVFSTSRSRSSMRKIRNGHAEVIGGDVFQFVRLVEDHHAGIRQHSGIRRAIGSGLDRQVGAEQVMVDDDDVALGGAPPHLGDEAAIELLAIGADAAVGARVQLGPQVAVLRQLGQFGAIAGLGRLLPVADDAELVDLFQSVQHRLAGEVVKLLAAEIIAAALHVADAQLAQVLLQKGNVFVEELLLQRLGSGRDDDALARANDRQQVRQRLAGAGARFDDQVTPFLQRLLDGLGHLQLSAAKLVRRMRARQHASGSEELVQRRQPCGQGSGL